MDAAQTHILSGIRVVELGVWVAGPAAGGLLADWGANVIKVEPPKGDPQRHVLKALGLRGDRVPPFEMDNRGKRSVVLDLQTDEGQADLHRLLTRADILITNMRPAALERLNLQAETIREKFPRLIYGRLSGYGPEGPDHHRAGYDVGAFWSRAGVPTRVVPPDMPPPNIPPAFGDHLTAVALVSGLMAALWNREKTGQGRLVDTSLLRTGIYGLGADFAMQMHYQKLAPRSHREHVPAPLVNCYQSQDGKWIWMLGVESARHWPNLLKALSREDMATDPRFADARARYKHRSDLIAEIDAMFKTKPRAAWADIFDAYDVWWAPVQTVEEVLDDPQAIASGAFVDIPAHGEKSAIGSVAGPISFDGVNMPPNSHAPELGEHTDEILSEIRKQT